MVAIKWVIAFAIIGCVAIAEVQGRRSSSSSSSSSDSSDEKHKKELKGHGHHGKHDKHDRHDRHDREDRHGKKDKRDRHDRHDKNDRHDRNQKHHQNDRHNRHKHEKCPDSWKPVQPEVPCNPVKPVMPPRSSESESKSVESLPPHVETVDPESLTKEEDVEIVEQTEPERESQESQSGLELQEPEPERESQESQSGLDQQETESIRESKESQSGLELQEPKPERESLESQSDLPQQEIESTQESKESQSGLDLQETDSGDKHVWQEEGLTDEENELLNQQKYELAFKESFYKNGLRSDIWRKDISGFRGGNDEFQYYSDNPYVCNIDYRGILFIRPQKAEDLVWAHEHNRPYNPLTDAYSERHCNMEPCWNQVNGDGGIAILSGRVKAQKPISLTKPGILVIKAKMPRGDYLWPIIQLLPVENKYGSYPTSGAITLAQTRGNLDFLEVDGKQVGNSVLESVVFFGGNGCTKRIQKFENIGKPLSDDYHTYKYTWDGQGNMEFFIDGKNYGKVDLHGSVKKERESNDCVRAAYEGKPDTAPFDNEFNLALMVAVGGRGTFRDYMKTNNKLQKNIFSYNDPTPQTKFLEIRDQWEPTWSNEKGEPVNALEVEQIRLYQGTN